MSGNWPPVQESPEDQGQPDAPDEFGSTAPLLSGKKVWKRTTKGKRGAQNKRWRAKPTKKAAYNRRMKLYLRRYRAHQKAIRLQEAGQPQT